MDSRTIRDIRETTPKWKNDGAATGAAHGIVNPGPEATPYDKARHEKMRLRSSNYGNFFLTHGSRPEKPRCTNCGKLKVWCDCA